MATKAYESERSVLAKSSPFLFKYASQMTLANTIDKGGSVKMAKGFPIDRVH